jgi:hypothetical protein
MPYGTPASLAASLCVSYRPCVVTRRSAKPPSSAAAAASSTITRLKPVNGRLPLRLPAGRLARAAFGTAPDACAPSTLLAAGCPARAGRCRGDEVRERRRLRRRGRRLLLRRGRLLLGGRRAATWRRRDDVLPRTIVVTGITERSMAVQAVHRDRDLDVWVLDRPGRVAERDLVRRPILTAALAGRADVRVCMRLRLGLAAAASGARTAVPRLALPVARRALPVRLRPRARVALALRVVAHRSLRAVRLRRCGRRLVRIADRARSPVRRLSWIAKSASRRPQSSPVRC